MILDRIMNQSKRIGDTKKLTLVRLIYCLGLAGEERLENYQRHSASTCMPRKMLLGQNDKKERNLME